RGPPRVAGRRQATDRAPRMATPRTGGLPMSAVIHRRLRRAIFSVASVTCVAGFASTGVALAACPTQPVSNPFSQWGDSNDYFQVPGGSFEGTADQLGWTLSNASLATGNEPFNVNDPGDQQSLTIKGGGSATSPFFC